MKKTTFIIRCNMFIPRSELKKIEDKIQKDLHEKGFVVIPPEYDVYVIEQESEVIL